MIGQKTGDAPASFGELLRDHRERTGLTQHALAARAGVSADALNVLERGLRRTPRPQTAARLALALDLDADALQPFLDGAGLDVETVGPAPSDDGGSERRPVRRAAIVALAVFALVVFVGELFNVVLTGSLLIPSKGGPLSVASVQLRDDSATTGHCPAATYTFRGVIRVASGAGTLRYHWVYPDGSRSRELSTQVAAGTREVDPRMAFQYTGSQAVQGTAALVASSPQVVYSPPRPVVYQCP